MDETKRLLKEAREHIEKKDFDDASKLVKSVLKKDKTNYMALVLLGVALQNTQQAPLAFKKAIAQNKDKPLAWQGLASYYERNNIVSEELIEAYINLLPFENDLEKYQSIFDKIVAICTVLDKTSKSAMMIYEYVLSLDNVDKKNIGCNTLCKVGLKMILTEDTSALQILHKIFELNSTTNFEYVEKFFEFSVKFKGFDYASDTYQMYIMGNDRQQVTDIILKNYSFYYVQENGFCSNNDCRKKFITNVLKNAKESSHKILAETLMLYDEKDYYEAYCKIRSITANGIDKTIFHIIAGNICLKLRRWLEAEHYSSIYQSAKSNDVMKRRLSKIRFVALCSQKNSEKCRKGIGLLEDVQLDMDRDELKALFLAYINLGEFVNAEKYLTSHDSIDLKYTLLRNIGKSDAAYNLLCENKNTHPACWFHLAQHFMEFKEYDNALLPLLQSAKYEKHNSEVFILLGDYYTLSDDNLEKAQKCYLKAFTLNPECDKAGKCLSSTYRNLKNWEANFKFLKELSTTQNCHSSWTCLELGLHHFALEQWDEAIVNLRTYVRSMPDDVEAWESLADAYYSRGSFTSALKCYEKSFTLNPRSYSVVQIGTVQYLLGDYDEALNTFNSVNDNVFVPALKGLSDVYIAFANDKLSHNLFASCRDYAQKAIDYISKALLCDHKFVCLWSSLSTAVLLIARLPLKYRSLNIASNFLNSQDGVKETTVLNEDLYLLAAQCLCRAINLTASMDISLCYELATVYLDHYKIHSNVTALQKAYVTMRNCLKMDKSNWQYWNLFGVICMCKDIKKYSLAQHAFLKAINLESSNAMVWSNLGVIYLFFGDIILANKAFQKAQQFDPSLMPSWIGQALIAESINHSDAMGLFLHSLQLGFHKESSIGYAECVCKNLLNKDLSTVSKLQYSMKNMHAIPIAYDLMTWLTEYENKSSYCLNILGILQEKMGLLTCAIVSYESALLSVEPNHKDIILTNYGRALYISGKYERAMEIFSSLQEEHLTSYCGQALCLNKLGKYQEAYSVYGTIFQWLAHDDYEKGQILVALASMAYKNNEIDNAKTLMYQCIEQDSVYNIFLPVILAGLSLSLLSSDKSLYEVTIGNLYKINTKNKYSNYVALFESNNLLKYQNISSAIRKLQEFLHIFPTNSNLWLYLSRYSSQDLSYPIVASKSAQKVVSFDTSVNHLNDSYIVASIAESCAGNVSQAIKFAQKAIHLHPNKADNWVLLIFAHISEKGKKKQWMNELFKAIKSCFALSKPLQKWVEYLDGHSRSLL